MSRLFASASVMVAAIVALTATVGVTGQERAIGTFFDDFSADWMRRRPSQTTQSRYLPGRSRIAWTGSSHPKRRSGSAARWSRRDAG